MNISIITVFFALGNVVMAGVNHDWREAVAWVLVAGYALNDILADT